MDHTQAIEGRAAERYLLGELGAGEAEEFERHYFECADCAEAVADGTEFIANARAVLAEGGIRPANQSAAPESRNGFGERLRAWWSGPALIPAAAAAVLAVVAIYQGFVVIPGLRQTFETARALPAFQLAGTARGAQTEIAVPAGTFSVGLSIDIPPDAHFPRYLCVLSAGGRTVFEVTAPEPRDGQPITVLAPTRGLSPGDYEFTVYGLTADRQRRDKVADSSFQFRLQ